ncbi:aminotransferase class I/II-fold pyridoxal phosphate-dependent enzyme [Brachybacterium huguangmaarense]
MTSSHPAPAPWQRAIAGPHLLSADGSARPTIFARMSARAAELGAMNLGQGFPDTDPPAAVAEAAIACIRDGVNQYPPGPGRLELREAIARHQARFHGLTIDPATEVLVTTGATEAIAASILALVEPSDEVVTLEPFYDSYAAMIALAGGVHRTVPLDVTTGGDDGDGSDLTLAVDPAALRAAITDRTRIVLVNSPHNPTGLVLDADALQGIVDAAAEHDAVIVSDEVYEHLTFGAPHVPIASLPGARERTITIGSAGKTFSVTGWKIGWITAPAPLVTAVTGIKQWLTYVSGAPFQTAVAAGLDLPDAEYDAIAGDLRRRRDPLVEALRGIGARVAVPDAGYFVVADLAPLGEADAVALCERLPAEAGVVAIPVGAFCHPDADGGHASRFGSLVRFAFCKDDATMAEAARRLEAWAGRRARV